MKVYIVVQAEDNSLSRLNCGVYLTEDQAVDHQNEMDECSGGGVTYWEVEEWDIE
jgi:hypothetical protein